MTVEEKTCQMGTIYGYRRVLKTTHPTAEWKERVWKDGVANIDEHCQWRTWRQRNDRPCRTWRAAQ